MEHLIARFFKSHARHEKLFKLKIIDSDISENKEKNGFQQLQTMQISC